MSSDTTDLHGRQEISVSWSGAHPTGGIVADQNSDDAQQEEYPFVLLECRGDDIRRRPGEPRRRCWTQTLERAIPGQLRQRLSRRTGWTSIAATGHRWRRSSVHRRRCRQLCTIDLAGVHAVLGAVGRRRTARSTHGGTRVAPESRPKSSDVGGSSLPSNETFGVTGLDGTGSAKFDVFTADENATLGCSQTVACSLVAVPIMGINCDRPADCRRRRRRPSSRQCEATGASAPGSLAQSPAGDRDLTVSGSLWWSPSNWQNRITVPLTSHRCRGACAVVNSNNVIDIYGSELMIQATSQWEPSFCL